jgi:hypothetical protein
MADYKAWLNTTTIPNKNPLKNIRKMTGAFFAGFLH